MSTIMPRLLACAALTLTVVAASAQAGPEPDPARAGAAWVGTWTNMNNTMHVRAGRCGDAMCGTVIWADDKTKADIASLDQTISGRIELTDPDSITTSGCALFGFGCQVRHWKRIR
jgi:uncharacterized protein (DUF2147 family)